MGGLLPNWEVLKNKNGKITQPSEAAEHWQEISETHDMPISPNVWLNSPLASSFPPSIAIKAAQMQNKIKAFHYHRRIKELLFKESKNITDIELLFNTVLEVGLDVEKFKNDINKSAIVKFEEDLQYAAQLKITVLPTFILSNEFNEKIILNGYQEYDIMEKAILDLYPLAQKDNTVRKPLDLFKIYQSMTTHEFSYLMEIDKMEAENILENLAHSGLVNRKKNNNGTIWKLNYSN
jgi:predicted DsbA family dithiol-disulfide isomerase